MCRIAGYLGRPVTVDALLSTPTRSLSVQARCPRELPPGMIGSDGFGFGWFAEHDGSLARYRSTLPIWVDENVDTMSPHVRSSSIVASSRTASRRMPVSLTNTPPFKVGEALLVHNGAIDDFHAKVLEPLRRRLANETRAHVLGNTDSEYLAALLHDQVTGDLTARITSMLRAVADTILGAGTSGQLNLVVADRDQLVAVRHAVGDAAVPSMWMRAGRESFRVASEPMEDHDDWTEVPEGAIVTVRRDRLAPVVARAPA